MSPGRTAILGRKELRGSEGHHHGELAQGELPVSLASFTTLLFRGRTGERKAPFLFSSHMSASSAARSFSLSAGARSLTPREELMPRLLLPFTEQALCGLRAFVFTGRVLSSRHILKQI